MIAPCIVSIAGTLLVCSALSQDPPRHISQPIPRGPIPARVHVFEDYETEIEKRWWLRGSPISDNLPPSLSSIPNRRACRATATKDFDDKQGDPAKNWNAVIFNPVPGPPMGSNTRLTFRYWLNHSDTLRVQIYSLSNGYHRHLTLTNLPQRAWQTATVDLTAARRPDGTGGPLSKDERIDDIQFYVTPDAELLIDDIVLYESAAETEKEPFPRRIIFTGWFDTGKQGAEWPGDFQIVNHDAPRTWKCATSIPNPATGEPWIRVNLRGLRPLGETTRLRFQYHLSAGPIRIILTNTATRQQWTATPADPLATDKWAQASVTFTPASAASADEIHFLLAPNATLRLDDLLLYQPANPPPPN